MEQDYGTETGRRSSSGSARGSQTKDLVGDLIEEGIDYVEEKVGEMNFDWRKVLSAVAIIGTVGALSALAMGKGGNIFSSRGSRRNR